MRCLAPGELARLCTDCVRSNSPIHFQTALFTDDGGQDRLANLSLTWTARMNGVLCIGIDCNGRSVNGEQYFARTKRMTGGPDILAGVPAWAVVTYLTAEDILRDLRIMLDQFCRGVIHTHCFNRLDCELKEGLGQMIEEVLLRCLGEECR